MRFFPLSVVLLSLMSACDEGVDTLDAPADEQPIMGALDKEVIDAEVKGIKRQMQQCFEEGLAVDPGISGRVSLKMVIEGDGQVSSVVTESSTLEVPEVEVCMENVMMSLQFPPPEGGGIVIVIYPFALAT